MAGMKLRYKWDNQGNQEVHSGRKKEVNQCNCDQCGSISVNREIEGEDWHPSVAIIVQSQKSDVSIIEFTEFPVL